MAINDNHISRRKLLVTMGATGGAVSVNNNLIQRVTASSSNGCIPSTTDSFNSENYESITTRDDHDETSHGGVDYSVQTIHNVTHFESHYDYDAGHGMDVWQHYFGVEGHHLSFIKDSGEWEVWDIIDSHEFIVNNFDLSLSTFNPRWESLSGYPEVETDPDSPDFQNALYTMAKQIAQRSPPIWVAVTATEIASALRQEPTDYGGTDLFNAEWQYSSYTCEAIHGLQFYMISEPFESETEFVTESDPTTHIPGMSADVSVYTHHDADPGGIGPTINSEEEYIDYLEQSPDFAKPSELKYQSTLTKEKDPKFIALNPETTYR